MLIHISSKSVICSSSWMQTTPCLENTDLTYPPSSEENRTWTIKHRSLCAICQGSGQSSQSSEGTEGYGYQYHKFFLISHLSLSTYSKSASLCFSTELIFTESGTLDHLVNGSRNSPSPLKQQFLSSMVRTSMELKAPSSEMDTAHIF